jgi:hypothetical protein
MKRFLISLAAIITTLIPVVTNAANSKEKCTFKGNLKNAPDTLLVFANPRSLQNDTVVTRNGSFNFSVNVTEPTIIYAYSPGSLRRQENLGFQVIAVPGESCVLSGDIKGIYNTDGSKFYKEYNMASKALDESSKPFIELAENLEKRMQAGESQEVIRKEYHEKMPAMREERINKLLAFIKANPRSEGSVAIIPQLGDLAKMKEAVALLSKEVREGRMKSIYQTAINQLEEQAQAESMAAAKQAAGTIAPDFTLNDPTGKPLSLSSLRGKYVVLDFWGTWCGWCIRGIPKMKEYYSKYKNQFEILSIDCNESKEKWLAGLKKYEMPWLHVYNPDNTSVREDYAIQGYPTKIIVGPDGKIVKTVVGEDPSFYQFLDDTFGEKK